MLRPFALSLFFMGVICLGQKVYEECRVMAESDNEPSPEKQSPEMHYLGMTVNWDAAKSFCQAIGKTLCRSDELCFDNNGGRQMIHDVIPGDFWTPVMDGQNKLMQVGDSRRFTCYTHKESLGGTRGSSFDAYPFYGYVYCCGNKFVDMKYQYIGKAATYDSSKKHCTDQRKRLCQSTEICTNNLPVQGVVAGEAWVAVKDRNNEWIQIGNVQTCSIYSVAKHGYPAWGNREDGTLYDFLGFVYCCPRL